MLNKKMFSLISVFFNNSKRVDSLEIGAIENGGATRYSNGIYSNYYDSDLIEVNNSKNILSLFVPSTINCNEKIDNNKYVNKYLSIIVKRYGIDDISIFNTNGSWYSDDMKKVVIEDISIISLDIKEVKKDDIDFFLYLAQEVKNDMKQEGVTVQVNSAIAIV